MENFQTAPLWRRLLAFSVDAGICYLGPIIVMTWNFGDSLSFFNNSRGLFWLITFSCGFLYFFVFIKRTSGQTLGSYFLNIRVVGEGRREISWWESYLRGIILSCVVFPFVLGRISLVLAVTFLILSLISMTDLNRKGKSQTFWDIGSKTRVVRSERKGQSQSALGVQV